MSDEMRKALDDEIDYRESSSHEISARHAPTGLGGHVELVVRGYGGAYDDGGPVANFAAILTFGPEYAYRIASELCAAANAAREVEMAERDEHRERSLGMKPIPGPFIVAPARKLTPEEQAAKKAGTPWKMP